MKLLTTAFFLANWALAEENAPAADVQEAAAIPTEAPASTVSTTTADPYYKDLKSKEFLQAFFYGAGNKKSPETSATTTGASS